MWLSTKTLLTTKREGAAEGSFAEKMSLYSIKNHITGAVIHSGDYESLQACIEHAISSGISLDYADLSHANLANASLDEARARHACFKGANLSGANMSEADFTGADFTGAAFYNTCLCASDLRRACFRKAVFGATDIAGSILDGAVFSSLSALLLNFQEAQSMEACLFEDVNPELNPIPSCLFSKPPLVLQGLSYPLAFLDRHIKIGHRLFCYDDILRACNDHKTLRMLADHRTGLLIHHNRDMLRHLIQSLRPVHFSHAEEKDIKAQA